MSPTDESSTDATPQDETAAVATTPEEAVGDEEVKEKLALDVRIETVGACERHITVTIPRVDVDRYFDEAYSELVEKAQVPGFRPGRAPRKLVESRFRKDVGEQVKGSLLMDSLAQLTEEHELAAISEPNIDVEAVDVPDEGPMTFEFDLEVRPEFDLPEWRGLTIERPVYEYTDADVDRRLQDLLSQHGKLVPFDGPAESGDYISVNLKFKDGEQEISSSRDEVLRLRPVLSFRDGKVEGFDTLMTGVKAGETRVGTARLSEDAPNAQLRGKQIGAEFEVLDVKKLELPELTPAFLNELGEFESEEELREAVHESLQRRLAYYQQQRVRQQVTAALTEAANWGLPQELLARQARREFERSILELRRSGFSEDEIRAHGNEIRQNSAASTAQALKEHFILERIAEEENVDDLPEDYDDEIELIAEQSDESPRRVRAQLEKKNLMDTLRNQIIERKVIDLILSQATFQEVPYTPEWSTAEAVDQSAGGGDEGSSEIPEAKYPDEPPKPGQTRQEKE